MIDYVTVFHRGGAVLWSHGQQQNASTNNTSSTPPPTSNAFIHRIYVEPINQFITDVLINDTAVKNNIYKHGDYCIKWAIDNQYDVIFIAIYLNITNLLYIDDLLNAVKHDFTTAYSTQLSKVYDQHIYDYSQRYSKILSRYENRSVSQPPKLANNISTPPKTLSASQSDHTINHSRDISIDADNDQTPADSGVSTPTNGVANGNVLTQSQSIDSFTSADKLLAPRTTPRKPGPMKKKNTTSAGTDDKKAAKPGKQMRTWDGQVSKHDAKTLDRSETSTLSAADVEQVKLNDVKEKFFADNGKPVDYSDTESDDDVDDANDDAAAASGTGWLSKTFNSISKNVSGVISGRTLDNEDLEPVIEALKSQLMSKNVAADIATTLCNQVQQKLLNTKTQSFTTIRSIVRDAVEQALTRVLTPRKPVDVLQGVQQARQEKRPYSIVMVGVNGVGKSTSLSKIASYFLSKKYKVGFGACDTFRAGAIEQLRTHATVLDVPLYSKGYDKDAAAVAYDAIQSAKRDNLDVVLIDTAGRMQHNEPLMKALSKLIVLNQPDLILFVGEALVGNDAVDQITEFNRALIDYSDTDKPRLIDGIVLTKFDTIDDKVGAAISLTYSTGIPIVFVGTGQTYRDLKKLNVRTINKLLMK